MINIILNIKQCNMNKLLNYVFSELYGEYINVCYT